MKKYIKEDMEEEDEGVNDSQKLLSFSHASKDTYQGDKVSNIEQQVMENMNMSELKANKKKGDQLFKTEYKKEENTSSMR